MDPSEVEFLSEKEIISIVPNFTHAKIYLIGVREICFTFMIIPVGSSMYRAS